MPRAATTTDSFNAIAEPRRRAIVEALSHRDRAVNDLAEVVGQSQPQVSKHLRILKEVGIVSVRDQGRQRVYRLNAAALRPVHDWTSRFEHLWSERFERIDQLLSTLADDEER